VAAVKTTFLLALGLGLGAAACESAKPAPDPVRPTTAAPPPTASPPAGPVTPTTTTTPPAPTETPMSIWDQPIKTLSGTPTSLAAYKGKALLLVNVASKCGLTPQYATLEQLQDKYGPQGFTVVGFPCNQFGGQEPGSAEQIQEFCSTTYGVSFPMMEKIDVNGAARHPIYAELTKVPVAGGGSAGDISWNFEKFVISADGSKVTRFAPKTKPDAPEVIAALEAALPPTK
jgi:glutathione peroxidase